MGLGTRATGVDPGVVEVADSVEVETTAGAVRVEEDVVVEGGGAVVEGVGVVVGGVGVAVGVAVGGAEVTVGETGMVDADVGG